jgi:hypothetical protein
MAETHRDTWISCTDGVIPIRGHCFPSGAETVRYGGVTAVRRVPLGALTRRYRLWGTADRTVRVSLGPRRTRRTRRSEGLLPDLGRRARPLLTPDDVNAGPAVPAVHGMPGARPGERFGERFGEGGRGGAA